MKSDENVSPILTKTDKNSGMYYVCHFYFHSYSWLLSVEMGLICDLMQCNVRGHIQLHIVWICVSESEILLPLFYSSVVILNI
jgi:hypothetical protein